MVRCEETFADIIGCYCTLAIVRSAPHDMVLPAAVPQSSGLDTAIRRQERRPTSRAYDALKYSELLYEIVKSILPLATY